MSTARCQAPELEQVGHPLESLRELRVAGRPLIERAPMPTRAEPPARQGGLGFLVDEFDDATIPVPASAWRSTVDPGVVVHSAQIERRGPGIYGILVPVLRVLHAEEGRLAGLAGVRARTTRPVFEVVVAPASAPHPAPVAPRAAGVPDDVPAGQRRLRKLGQ